MAESSWTPWVVLVASNALEPLSHRLLINLLRVGPSGVLRSLVHPHGLVTGLQGLDPPTEIHLQQIHPCHSSFNQFNNGRNQHLHFLPLIRSYN